ncbi:protein transport protein SEC23 G isoform X2 [Musa acuminata AAA Group]|uniref:protein transport protein SEC23 G isoform X2 n=1 Tax=Musa acuminata AAA Group TaxID=214697 RepID=UPI0008A0E7CA|nr:PREDICTED: protein transport protein sec23-1 isoform X2 [Musa acuminata subsp. malaccensis]
MDFAELEAIEGLRWPWNAWPPSRSDAAALVVPLSVMCSPLMPLPDLPVLPYEPLLCASCRAALNPYARVDYRSALWTCPFCSHKNPFPRTYAGIGENNLPAELFPTYSTVEYALARNPRPNPGPRGGFGLSSSSVPSSLSASASSSSLSGLDASRVLEPAFVFVVDVCSEQEELRALKNEILHVVAQLPENTMVGLISFGSMVWVHDLGYTDCPKVMVFCGDRELTSEKIQQLMRVSNHSKLGMAQSIQKHGFLLPVSECEFNFTSWVEELNSTHNALPGHRPSRATGAAISTAVALLEVCSVNAGGRVMVFTSGPATIGPGMIAETDLSKSIRTHRDLVNGNAPFTDRARGFYKQLAHRLVDGSFVLDLFACSLDQVGTAEIRYPIESSGGFLVLADSFESEQFRKCLRHIFKREGADHLNMNFDATIEIVTTKEVKICGALGPCMSLRKKNNSVSEKEIGHGGTNTWKMSTLMSKTCIAFIFQVSTDNVEPPPVLFIQFMTRYRHGNGGFRLRVTTAARRWVKPHSPELTAGFDQEAAAAVMARLAVHRAEEYHARDVIRWLDKMLIRFTAKFGDYVPEDPSTFRTPDETAFFRLMLNREGVVGSLIMIQPTLFQYSFDGPPIPVLLDVSSISPDVILLFDSYFHIVIHYGSKIAQWRKLGYDKDPNHENLRKLLEAPEIDAEALIADRIPVPKLVKCDQHGSQARFLLARLNPSVTQKTLLTDGSEVIFTDDVSLQVFIEHLQELAVQG